jgi:NAD(P)-dependent dehydrogenase (short-subunit alcohol dehydrogenase family)
MASLGTALVTGASNGIGSAVADALDELGYRVVGLDVEPSPRPLARHVDVADVEGHASLVDAIEAEHGRIAALANVAGIFIPESVEELTLSSYRRQHAVMLDGPIFLARAAGLRMAATGGGRIVNVTSVHASNGEARSLAYDSAKAGLEAATRSLAIELGPHGVLVNSVAPGFVRTRLSFVDGRDELESEWFQTRYRDGGLLPVRRPAEPPEIAAAVAHLLSPANTYVTGTRLVVDGGLLVTF